MLIFDTLNRYKKVTVIVLLVAFLLGNPALSFCKKNKKKNKVVPVQEETVQEQVLQEPEKSDIEEITDFADTNITKESIDENHEMFKEYVCQADQCLNNALIACDQDNYIEAKENYHKFLGKLNSLDLKPEEIEFLLTDCENILRKIKNINGLDTNKSHIKSNDALEISMAYDEETLNYWIEKYSKGRAAQGIRIALERSGKYKDLILPILKEYNLPEDLQYLPIIESLFNNNATSSSKAVGMWQIMAHRGQALGLKINYWVDERKDPVKATRAAAKYLRELYILLNDWHLALSAYNRGEYGLIRDMKFSNSSSVLEMKERNALPKETQLYIPKFIASVKIAKNPEEYGFHNLNYQQPLKYDTVIIDKVIDLKVVAKCANTTVERIQELNPSILAWCTPHGYKDFELNLPEGTRDMFLINISKEKELNPSSGFIKYKIKKGDNLERIAKEFRTTTSAIKEDNPKLKKQKYLQPKQVITVRPGRKYYNK
ncbi:MAG: transglycosylase SLT domain-containing protein [Elusimicrobia bacterium]|nr:transglycosylase SLT domain-containing protein [Elusimicrobiota bacterium]